MVERESGAPENSGISLARRHVVGGYDGSYLSSGEKYDPATDTWTPIKGMSTARYVAVSYSN